MNSMITTNSGQDYIDKTEGLQKGIERFPSVFLEGVAGSGKSTSVKIFLEKNKDIESHFIYCDEENEESLIIKINKLKNIINEKDIFAVFENVSSDGEYIISDRVKKEIEFLTRSIRNNSKVIIISREEPDIIFLQLIWNDTMSIVRQSFFTLEEVNQLSKKYNRQLNPRNVYECTGGFPGVTVMLYKLATWNSFEGKINEIIHSYEIKKFVYERIINTLSIDERNVLDICIMCPWIDDYILRDIWKINNADIIIEKLYRKSLIINDKNKKTWIIPEFIKEREYINNYNIFVSTKENIKRLKDTESYYESKKDIINSLHILNEFGDTQERYDFLIKHYFEIPYSYLNYIGFLEDEGLPIEGMYLKAMYYYKNAELETFKKIYSEVKKYKTQNKKLKNEILLNLMFVNPSVSINEWIEYVDSLEKGKYRLYMMLGSSVTYLCGLKDVTDLFACSKKEERRKANIWKDKFQDKEFMWYELAKSDYYVEIEKEKEIKADNMVYINSNDIDIRMAVIYILYRTQDINSNYNLQSYINEIESRVLYEKNNVNLRNITDIYYLYSEDKLSYNELVEYLRNPAIENKEQIDESNYFTLCMMAKAYLYTNQYSYAEKILKYLIPYLQKFGRTRFLIEAQFAMAVLQKEIGNDKEARNIIMEIFIIGNKYRYVEMFSGYGDTGTKLIKEYIELKKANSIEEFKIKKKYNYSSVLNMPDADYMERIYKRCKKRQKKLIIVNDEYNSKEKLTMMEAMVLQGIYRGLTNADICDELNLKLSTVKSHIYRLYKKLGVTSRVQAIAKAKNLGILK